MGCLVPGDDSIDPGERQRLEASSGHLVAFYGGGARRTTKGQPQPQSTRSIQPEDRL